MSAPKPIYNNQNVRSLHRLAYTWTGWSTTGQSIPAITPETWKTVVARWREDGLIAQASPPEARPDTIQIAFTLDKPDLAPAFIAQRAKGRLDHAIRKAGTPVKWSRKVAVRSVGEINTEQVIIYVRQQHQASPDEFADPTYRAALESCSCLEALDAERFTQSSSSASGRYWNLLHLVLVLDERARMSVDQAKVIGQAIPRLADKKDWRAGVWALMPDHVHLTLHMGPEVAAGDMALSVMNNLA